MPTDQSKSAMMKNCRDKRVDERVMIAFKINEGNPNANDHVPSINNLIRRLPMIMIHNSDSIIIIFSLSHIESFL
jgi:hypothetical protein